MLHLSEAKIEETRTRWKWRTVRRSFAYCQMSERRARLVTHSLVSVFTEKKLFCIN